MRNEKMILDYIDITMMCESLANQMKDSKPDLVVGLTRGGLVPAVHLSHLLGVPMECVNWSTRDGDSREHNLNVSEAIEDGKTVVFVDDINDSGETLYGIMNHYDYTTTLRQCLYATLISKESSRFTVDFTADCIHSKDEDKWVVFPWELNND